MRYLWEIVPFEQCGPITFGMTRSETRAILGPEFKSFQKFDGPRGLVDKYSELGVFLYYNDNGALCFVESRFPCVPTYSGVTLVTNGVDAVLEAMRGAGELATKDSSGYRFDRLGITLYVPFGGRLELVGICNRDELGRILQSEARSAVKREQRRNEIEVPSFDWPTKSEKEPGNTAAEPSAESPSQ